MKIFQNFLATLLVLTMTLSLTACGTDTNQPINETYVHAGKLVDVLSGQILDDHIITIQDERIINVRPMRESDQNLDVIDWSNYTVLPGLIDGHTHLVGDIQSDDVLAPIKATPEEDLNLGIINAAKTLNAGFTSVIDVGTYRAFVDTKLRDMINNGEVAGPRMMVSGAYVTAPGGGGEVVGLDAGVDIPAEFRAGVASNEEEIRDRVNYLLDNDVNLIKVIATGAVLTVGTEPGEPEFTEQEIRAAVEEAAKRGKYVTAHAHGAEGIKMAIRAGVRSIQHGSLMDDEGLTLMKEHGTWLIADIYNGDYINEVGAREGWPEETMRKNRDTTETQRAVFRKAVKLGVKLVFGTDSGVYPHGTNANQMAYMVKHGLSPMEAIQSATIWGAEAMSLENDVGSITGGKFADMIAVEGNILENIRILEDVKGVIKGGKVYK